jgi:phosphatidylserine synthase
MDPTSQPVSASEQRLRAAAFSVHIFTAMGAGIALLALLDAVREHWASMFAWLGVALIIDAIDGPMARKLDIMRLQPNWSGEVLDLVVDFVTYVFVPAYAITASHLLLPLAAPILGLGIVVSSALYFADRRMKAEDNHFRGRVLPVPAASAGGTGEPRRRRSDCADLCADPCAAPDPGGAPALADPVAARCVGTAGAVYGGL